MRFAVAAYYDDELSLQIVEAPSSLAATLKFAADVLGFDSLDLEDDADADDVVSALADEGVSMDYLVIA